MIIVRNIFSMSRKAWPPQCTKKEEEGRHKPMNNQLSSFKKLLVTQNLSGQEGHEGHCFSCVFFFSRGARGASADAFSDKKQAMFGISNCICLQTMCKLHSLDISLDFRQVFRKNRFLQSIKKKKSKIHTYLKGITERC